MLAAPALESQTLKSQELSRGGYLLCQQANWEADNLNHLRSLLEGRSAEEVRKLLSHPDRSAVSELEVR